MPLPLSPFLVAPAADAWDAWVRWRDGGQLRDLTVEASWQRVAQALGEVDDGRDFAVRCFDALLDWRLLLDPRILATAGTGSIGWPADGLSAALNAAAFVRQPLLQPASVDLDGVRRAARLTVQALDNASLLAGGPPRDGTLQIGLIGVADALRLLGIDYGSAGALALVADMAAALANGTTEASLWLAGTRGARAAADAVRLRQLAAACSDVGPSLTLCLGSSRWRQLTRIDRQPALAQLANGVADALDPLTRTVAPARRAALGGASCSPSRCAVDADDARRCSVSDQLRLRGAAAPWIDAPIDYPLRVDVEPDGDARSAWQALADQLGLPAPRGYLHAR